MQLGNKKIGDSGQKFQVLPVQVRDIRIAFMKWLSFSEMPEAMKVLIHTSSLQECREGRQQLGGWD